MVFGINSTRNADRKVNSTRLRLVLFCTFLSALLVLLIPNTTEKHAITYTNTCCCAHCPQCDGDSMAIVIGSTDDILVMNAFVAFSVYGITVKDRRNVNISFSKIASTSSGMVFNSSTGLSIWNVLVNQSTNTGIHISSCQYASILDTRVTHTEGSGIYLTKSSHTDIVTATDTEPPTSLLSTAN